MRYALALALAAALCLTACDDKPACRLVPTTTATPVPVCR